MVINTKKDLQPKLKHVLKKVPEEDMYHSQHELKHPLAIYNTSWSKVERNLSRFLDKYNQLDWRILFEDKDSGTIDDILSSYKAYLYSLREHLDDCLHIAKIFVEPQEDFRENRNQYIYLEMNSEVAKNSLFPSIRKYKDYLDSIVNNLKHNNAIINSLIFYHERREDFSPGYFVANVVGGRFQPVEDVHEEWRNCRTAFSFARDVRWNIFNCYKLSQNLVSFIKEVGVNVKDEKIDISKAKKERVEMYQDVMGLSRHFFPDEQEKGVPNVVMIDSGGEDILKLEFPSPLPIKKPFPKMILSHSGDGVTREFALLYGVKNS